MTKTSQPLKAAPPAVGESTDKDGSAVYLYGSHSEAIAAAEILGGEVERRNLWAVVVVKGGK